jgi:hypothetical protein
LVSLEHRRASARNWEHLLDVIGRDRGRPYRRIPLCRERITAAEPDVRAMLCALETPLPVPVRGVAMAGLLLSDGAGPLYNRRCSTDLSEAVHQVTGELSPSASLVASV